MIRIACNLSSRLMAALFGAAATAGEVFGHLAADRTLENAHVRSVQRLSVRYEVPLLGVTRARVHVRLFRWNQAHSCLVQVPRAIL